jgi:hypothetical protein
MGVLYTVIYGSFVGNRRGEERKKFGNRAAAPADGKWAKDRRRWRPVFPPFFVSGKRAAKDGRRFKPGIPVFKRRNRSVSYQ